MFRLAAGFSIGVVAAATAPFTLPWLWMLAALFPLAVLRRLFLAALVAGCVWAAWHADRELARWLPLEQQGREVEVTARVSGLPVELEQGWRVPLVLEERPADLPVQRIQLYWHGQFGAPAAGERWALSVRLRRPSSTWNPEGFDGERWALTQRIHARASLASGTSPERLSGPRGIHAWRGALSAAIRDAVPQPRAQALAVALVVGDRQYLSDRQWHQLLVTGTNHLVAISGLHVSLLAGAVWLLVSFLWRGISPLANRYPAMLAGAWPALLAAATYAMLAGFSLPTQRAVLMFAVLAVALLLRRSLHAGQCLLAAITLMLVHDPLAPANPTFWLSSLAVAALVIVALGWRRAPLQGWLRAQLALLIVLAPVTAYWFGQIAWVAPAANAVAVPLVGALVVPVLLLGALALPVLPATSEFLWQWGGWMLLGLDWLTDWLAGLVDLHRTAESLPWWLGVAGMMGALLVVMPRHFPGRLLALPLLMPLLLVSDTNLPSQRAKVTLFDVGHGHAMRVQTRDHVLWLDSGPAGWSAAPDAHGSAATLVYSRARAGYKGGFDAAGVQARPLCELSGRWEWNGVRFQVFSLPGNGCALLLHAGGETLLALQGLERPVGASDLEYFHERADIVIAPGHGHRKLSIAALSQLGNIRDVLVSTNADNRWGLPHQEVRDAAAESGARLWVTGCHGALQVMLGSGRGARAPEHRRYWWRQARGQNCEP